MAAFDYRVRGIVQGVAFRPFAFRLAKASKLAAWVLNNEDGVGINLEGSGGSLDAFLHSLRSEGPLPLKSAPSTLRPRHLPGFEDFTIRQSERAASPATHISPDHGFDTVVLSGRVFQNQLLLPDIKVILSDTHLEMWIDHQVPSNDGGISLGQAAIAALHTSQGGGNANA